MDRQQARIFALRAGTYLEELERHRPAMAQAVREAVANGREDGMRFYPDPAPFARIEGESIDYAVMEETDRAAMVPVSMGWSDIGDWRALHGAHAPDEAGNCWGSPRVIGVSLPLSYLKRFAPEIDART